MISVLVRASLGSLATLGIYSLKLLAKPTTLYILQYSPDGCQAGCKFCPQAKINNADKNFVARVPWPLIELDVIIDKLKKGKQGFSRICVQNVLKKDFRKELIEVVLKIRKSGVNLPLSITITPVEKDFLVKLKNLGVDRLGIGLDAATPVIFEKIGKPYSWRIYMDFIDSAVRVFGRRNVSVHLIFGMGEGLKEFVDAMKLIYDKGAEVALFAFTPIKNTQLENLPKPNLHHYRVVQMARYLLSKNLRDIDDFRRAFLTSGCPGCNRPFYNESPRKIYNYPSEELLENMQLTSSEIKNILAESLALLEQPEWLPCL